MNKLKKLIKYYKKYNFIDDVVPIIDLLSPIKYSPNQKYDNKYFLICLIDFINNSSSWSCWNASHSFAASEIIYYFALRNNILSED